MGSSVMYYVVYVVLLFAASLSRAAAASASPRIFCVLSYGAMGDGASDDSKPFRAAWVAACQADRPAVFLVPRHYSFIVRSVYFTGPCNNQLTFRIEGRLMPPEEPKSWPDNRSKRRWLVFNKIDGMTVHGGGVVDGRGQKWWDLPCKRHRGVNGTTLPFPCYSPMAIMFTRSSNLVVGDLEVKNSPQFHVRFEKCQNVNVDSLYINSPAGSPNTDGIHVGKSNNVNIYNSVIATGDDCISIGAATFNVDIRNITCDHSHGISIGSLGRKNTTACVSNITVRDSVVKNSDNGVRIKTWQGGYGAVSDVSFTNIAMDNVRNPIIIDQYYHSDEATSTNQSSAAVHVTGISYTNIKGTYDSSAPPMHLACSDTLPCTKLTLSDVELQPAQGRGMADPFCWNAYGDGGAVTVPPLPCLNQGEPLFVPANGDDRCSVVDSGPAVRGVEPRRQPKSGNMLGLNTMYIVDILSMQFSFFLFLPFAFLGIVKLAPRLLFIPSYLRQ